MEITCNHVIAECLQLEVRNWVWCPTPRDCCSLKWMDSPMNLAVERFTTYNQICATMCSEPCLTIFRERPDLIPKIWCPTGKVARLSGHNNLFKLSLEHLSERSLFGLLCCAHCFINREYKNVTPSKGMLRRSNKL